MTLKFDEDGSGHLYDGTSLSDILVDLAARIDDVVGHIRAGGELHDDRYILTAGAKRALITAVRECSHVASLIHALNERQQNPDWPSRATNPEETTNRIDPRLQHLIGLSCFRVTVSQIESGEVAKDRVDQLAEAALLVQRRAETERERESECAGDTLAGSKARIVPNLDFRQVLWGDKKFTFTAKQAAAVRVLFEEWIRTGMGVGEEAIGNATDQAQDRFRLRDLFRSKGKTHPSWGTMIVSDGAAIYRLANPENFGTP